MIYADLSSKTSLPSQGLSKFFSFLIIQSAALRLYFFSNFLIHPSSGHSLDSFINIQSEVLFGLFFGLNCSNIGHKSAFIATFFVLNVYRSAVSLLAGWLWEIVKFQTFYLDFLVLGLFFLLGRRVYSDLRSKAAFREFPLDLFFLQFLVLVFFYFLRILEHCDQINLADLGL